MGTTIKIAVKWVFWIIYCIVLYSLYAEFAGVPIEDQASIREIRERNYFIIGLLLVLPFFYLTFNKNRSVHTGVLVGQNYLINNDTTLSIEERDISYSRFEKQVKWKFMVLNIIPWLIVLIVLIFIARSNIVMSILVIFVTSTSLVYLSKNDVFHIFRPEKSFRSPNNIGGNFYENVDRHLIEAKRRQSDYWG